MEEGVDALLVEGRKPTGMERGFRGLGRYFGGGSRLGGGWIDRGRRYGHCGGGWVGGARGVESVGSRWGSKKSLSSCEVGYGCRGLLSLVYEIGGWLTCGM